MERFTKRLEDGGTRLNIADYGEPPYPVVTNDFVKRLAYYEDLEEQGRLVFLPCKIGDVVYRVCKKKYDVDGYGMQWEEDWGIVTNTFHLGMFHEIGKNVFLTREEAEDVLKSK